MSDGAQNLMPSDSADIIVAPATASGPGAIAIVRLDGPACWTVASRVIHSASNTPPKPRHMTLVNLIDADNARLDEAMIAWFPSPKSYTGNNLVEFYCHGSPAIVASLTDALQAAGARMARPGEFTERAFFNGRVDLAQAEGVANLVAARTRAAGRAALSQLRGALSIEVSVIHEILIDLAAEIEARIDFPEEEIEATDRQRMECAFGQAAYKLSTLITTARRGRLFRDGARVVIAGRPNAGKSSIFNALVGMERALVTPHPGTTRDTIEATLDVYGIPIVLIDTAGVRSEGAEEIETLGINRTMREIEMADLTLFVVDATSGPSDEDRHILSVVRQRPFLLVLNKIDLPDASNAETVKETLDPEKHLSLPLPLSVCALQNETLAGLERLLADNLMGDDEAALSDETAIVTNQRHEERLRQSLVSLTIARQAFDAEASGEFIMVDLTDALQALAEILGVSIDEAILDRVFSRFCIGK